MLCLGDLGFSIEAFVLEFTGLVQAVSVSLESCCLRSLSGHLSVSGVVLNLPALFLHVFVCSSFPLFALSLSSYCLRFPVCAFACVERCFEFTCSFLVARFSLHLSLWFAVPLCSCCLHSLSARLCVQGCFEFFPCRLFVCPSFALVCCVSLLLLLFCVCLRLFVSLCCRPLLLVVVRWRLAV